MSKKKVDITCCNAQFEEGPVINVPLCSSYSKDLSRKAPANTYKDHTYQNARFFKDCQTWVSADSKTTGPKKYGSPVIDGLYRVQVMNTAVAMTVSL